MLKIFLWMPTVLQALFDIFLILNKNVHEKKKCFLSMYLYGKKASF